MDKTIKRPEILALLGVETTNVTSYFNNMEKRGRLPDFPKPIGKDGVQFVYDRAKVLAYIDNPSLFHSDVTAFAFISGRYSNKYLKTIYSFRRMIAKLNKPSYLTVKCHGVWPIEE